MPAAIQEDDSTASMTPPCMDQSGFNGCEKCLSLCLNCRKAVEASMTRVAGRKLRKLRKLPECSVSKCHEFLKTVENMKLRFHLASMAWWRFSADVASGAAEPLRRMMHECPPDLMEFGEDYLHLALRELSKLSQEQLSAWFGFDNLYAIASVFIGDRMEGIGEHCLKCRLYKLGCTAYNTIGADECPLWKDKITQGVAAAVGKNGGDWDNPCDGLEMDES